MYNFQHLTGCVRRTVSKYQQFHSHLSHTTREYVCINSQSVAAVIQDIWNKRTTVDSPMAVYDTSQSLFLPVSLTVVPGSSSLE